MTTARERAREAVQSSYNKVPPYGYMGTREEISTRFADAASDVWEPLLTKAFYALYKVQFHDKEVSEIVGEVYQELFDALGMKT